MKRHKGEHGSTLIGGTTAQDGRWFEIQFLAATVFASLTNYGADASSFWDVSIAGQSFPSLSSIEGDFTRIKLVSGSVMAYKQVIP